LIFITHADKKKITITKEAKNVTEVGTGRTSTIYNPWIMSVDTSVALHPGDTILFPDDTGYYVWAILSHDNNQIQYSITETANFLYTYKLSIGEYNTYQYIGSGQYIEYDLNFDLPTDPKLTKRSLMTISQYIDSSSKEAVNEQMRRKSKYIHFFYRKSDPRYAKLDKSILDNLQKIPADTVIIKTDYITYQTEYEKTKNYWGGPLYTIDTVTYMEKSGKIVRQKIKADSLQNLLRRR
jgi:hypothetical protein